MKPRWISAIGALALLVCAMSSHAQWSTDPTVNNAICTATNLQSNPTIVSDGAGGAIITWIDNRSGNYDVYAQRINTSGVVQWTADGVAICTATNYQFYPTIASDGAGGAIITWYDLRNDNYDIYAQRINASGVVQWTADGVAICTATNSQSSPTIVSDGAGGAIITWSDFRTLDYDIYAQRINASGVVQWTAGGVAICTATNIQQYPTIVSNGAGGAIITWWDRRNSFFHPDIYAQRINASGVVEWTAGGVATCTATNIQIYPTIVSDGAGGAIITWYDYRSGYYSDIYAQRINASGVVQWTVDGVAICTATNHQVTPTIVSDGACGAIITWYDSRSGSYSDIYAQRINASGAVQWTVDGVAICTATDQQYYPNIVSDGAGGAIITWYDNRNGYYSNIYAQRINASGVGQWTTDGVAICTATNYQDYPTIVSDGAGGAIITWQDYRNGSYSDIYAQRVRSDGTLGGNSAPLADAGSVQTVIVNEMVQLDGSGSNDPDGDPLTYAWEITSKPAGSGATLSDPIIVNPTFIADVVGEYRVSLFVNDGTGNSTPDEVIITAITAQDATQNLIDQVLALVDASILNQGQGNGLIAKLEAAIQQLDNGNTNAAINQLRSFINQVYDFMSSTPPLLTAAEGQPLIDAANAIIATQSATGKAAQLNSGSSDDMIKTEGALPTGYRLEQNSPNPFNPVTTIQFSVPRESYVRLKVYNAFGAEVATLVDQQVAAGTYKVNWDASRLASGFYLYRLEAEGFAQTKKLLLMK